MRHRKLLKYKCRKTKKITLAGKSVNILGLEQALAKLDVESKKQTAVIRADKILPYGDVIEVMGLLQKAGVLDISVAVK
jgi:biopolymer transport protein ExbD